MHCSGKRLKGRRLVQLTLQDGKAESRSCTLGRREDKAKICERVAGRLRRLGTCSPRTGYGTPKSLFSEACGNVLGVGDAVELAAPKVERLGFALRKRPSSAAAEYGDLVAGFVHGAIPVDSLGESEGGTLGLSGGDQFWLRARAETGK